MSKLNVDFNTKYTTKVLREFRELTGRETLARALDKVHRELKRRKIVSQALLNRLAVPIGLRKVVDYEKNTGRSPKPQTSAEVYAACIFAVSAVEMSKLLSTKGQQRLVGMIKDGLSLNSDTRRLQHEFTAAAHFSRRGWDIIPVDLEEDGNFDFIIGKDRLKVDVECKTISGDKGNPIHQMDALNFMENVHEQLLEIARSGCWTVDITFAEGLPKNSQDQIALARKIANCMQKGGQSDLSGMAVNVERRDMPLLGTDGDRAKFVGQVMGPLQERLNGHVGSIFNSKRMLVLSLSSSRRTKLVNYSNAEIKKGCEQLSQRRAGYVWTHFVDLTDEEMRELVSDNAQTALDTLSTRIFKNENRRYVSALSYSGESTMRQTTEHLPKFNNRTYSKQGILPTHYNSNATYPLSMAGGFP